MKREGRGLRRGKEEKDDEEDEEEEERGSKL